MKKGQIKNFFSSLFSHERKTLAFILLVCLVVRMGFFIAVQPWKPEVVENVILKDDAKGYHELGISLTLIPKFNKKGWEKETLRTPLYPFVIMALYSIFGSHPWVVLIFQIFLDSLTCGLLYTTMKSFISQKAAIGGIVFYIFDPGIILYSTKLLSETIFLFILVIFFYFFVLVLKEPNSSKAVFRIALSGLFLGFSALIKPIGIYLFFLALPFLIAFRDMPVGRVFKFSGIFVISYFLILFPWYIRNKTTFGVFAFSTNRDYNWVALYTAPMLSEKWKMPVKTTINRLFSEADSIIVTKGENPHTMNGFQKSVYWRKLAWQYISAHPVQFIRSYAQGILNCFFVLGVENFSISLRIKNRVLETPKTWRPGFLLKEKILNKNSIELAIGIALALFHGIAYFCALCGFIAMKRDSVFVFLLLMAGFFIFASGPSGYVRFRLPAIPFYLPMVGVGYKSMMDKISYRIYSMIRSRKGK